MEKQNFGNSCKSKLSIFRYPKAVFFCLGNEFSERFSFYGMTAILTLYLHNVHGMSESGATLTYHVFSFLAYFSPIFGSIVADGFLGRYRVILYVSIFYCFGHLLITLSAVDIVNPAVRKILDLSGLFVIAVSTGGIKPCVIPFAADQFSSTQTSERKEFFSFFYLSINLGALLAVILTPIFRTELSYAVAFGVPAIFMALALTLFICGRPFYRIDDRKLENVIWQSAKCITVSLIKLIKNKGHRPPNGHWLDYSIPKFGKPFVEDVKTVLSIATLYVPLIFFWSLFVQQGSTWVLQANRMNGRLGKLTIVPEQIGVINPILIIVLIPLFEKIIYPMLNAKNLLTKSLQRISFGGILVAISFVIAGFIQIKINRTTIDLLGPEESRYTIANMADVRFNVSTRQFNVSTRQGESVSVILENSEFPKITSDNSTLKIMPDNGKHNKTVGKLIILWNDTEFSSINYGLEKTENSNAKLYVVFHPFFVNTLYANFSVLIVQNDRPNNVTKYTYANDNSSNDFVILKRLSVWGEFTFNLSLEICINNENCSTEHLFTYDTLPGEAKCLVITQGSKSQQAITTGSKGHLVDLVPANSVHIMWQIPQYSVITVAEIFFSVSGLEFSYSQAAPSMKSLVQALWLITSALGNVVDIVISGSGSIENKAVEFFVYASLMIAVIIVFMFLSHRYKYIEEKTEDNCVEKVDKSEDLEMNDRKSVTK